MFADRTLTVSYAEGQGKVGDGEECDSTGGDEGDDEETSMTNV